MKNTSRHINQSIESSILIEAPIEVVWENITDVKIEEFSDPFLFKLLNIPKPLKAEIVAEGKGGKRIAYFSSGKKFNQEILEWELHKRYAFSFNPDKGFKVGYLLDISDGVFQIKTGAYTLEQKNDSVVELKLSTDFSLYRYVYPFFIIPVHIVLRVFQRYLLTSIRKNSVQ